jgi:hypothetical protein
MSEPDNPRWLEDVSDELRREVPVRASWRTRLLDDVAHSRRPSEGDDFDDRFDDVTPSAPAAASRRRSIVLTPVTGLAAALLFAVLGAGVMYGVLSRGAKRNASRAEDGGRPAATPTAPLAASTSAPDDGDRETVRFELAAPRASRVMLVGSFNEWNPAATPLVRDVASGKWVVSLRLPPGRHVYAFVVDGDVTADPTAPRAADDDFGSANSVVLVASPRT